MKSVIEPSPATPPPPVVRFEGVGIRYGHGPETLGDLTFALQPRSFHFLTVPSGAGKTTAIDAARDAHQLSGWQVLGTATSGQAARTLQAGAGIQSSTVRSLLCVAMNSLSGSQAMPCT